MSVSQDEFYYHYCNLLELDPDQVVSDLQLTTEEILDAFPLRVAEYINEEFG